MEHRHRALLLFCLLGVFCSARAYPPPRDSVTTRANVKLMAEQLVFRLDQYLKWAGPTLIPGLSASPPTDPLDGLSTLVLVLEGYENVISERLEGLAQVKQETSSLGGYLEDWRERQCGGGALPKQALQGRAARLQNYKRYIHTVALEAAVGLKDYLVHLLKNLDYLGAC